MEAVLAKATKVSLREVSAAVNGERKLAPTALRKLSQAAAQLEAADREQANYVLKLLEAVKELCQHVDMRKVAAQSGVDRTNLAHVLSGRRKPRQAMLAKLDIVLTQAFKSPNRPLSRGCYEFD